MMVVAYSVCRPDSLFLLGDLNYSHAFCCELALIE
jgi:hypothetical protein